MSEAPETTPALSYGAEKAPISEEAETLFAIFRWTMRILFLLAVSSVIALFMMFAFLASPGAAVFTATLALTGIVASGVAFFGFAGIVALFGLTLLLAYFNNKTPLLTNKTLSTLLILLPALLGGIALGLFLTASIPALLTLVASPLAAYFLMATVGLLVGGLLAGALLWAMAVRTTKKQKAEALRLLPGQTETAASRILDNAAESMQAVSQLGATRATPGWTTPAATIISAEQVGAQAPSEQKTRADKPLDTQTQASSGPGLTATPAFNPAPAASLLPQSGRAAEQKIRGLDDDVEQSLPSTAASGKELTEQQVLFSELNHLQALGAQATEAIRCLAMLAGLSEEADLKMAENPLIQQVNRLGLELKNIAGQQPIQDQLNQAYQQLELDPSTLTMEAKNAAHRVIRAVGNLDAIAQSMVRDAQKLATEPVKLERAEGRLISEEWKAAGRAADVAKAAAEVVQRAVKQIVKLIEETPTERSVWLVTELAMLVELTGGLADKAAARAEQEVKKIRGEGELKEGGRTAKAATTAEAKAREAKCAAGQARAVVRLVNRAKEVVAERNLQASGLGVGQETETEKFLDAINAVIAATWPAPQLPDEGVAADNENRRLSEGRQTSY